MAIRDSKQTTFESLDVYNIGLDLVELTYRVTSSFPSEERFGLTSQIRRAATSIPANIAEGWGRGHGAANANFIRIGRGSIYELRALFAIASRLGFLSAEKQVEIETMLDREGRLIQAYLKSIEANLIREDTVPYIAEIESQSRE